MGWNCFTNQTNIQQLAPSETISEAERAAESSAANG